MEKASGLGEAPLEEREKATTSHTAKEKKKRGIRFKALYHRDKHTHTSNKDRMEVHALEKNMSPTRQEK